jgi:hypothetical protein
MRKVSAIFILFWCVSVHTFAQVKVVEPGKPNELDKKFVPGGNSVLNPTGSANTSSSDNGGENSAPDFKNVIKNNCALWPRGIAAFGYERFLTDEISLEAMIGVAYNKDPIFSTIGSAVDISDNQSSAISLYEMYRYGKKNGTSIYFSGSVKFHFSGWSYWNDNNSYIELGMRTYGNKLDVTLLKNNYNANNPGSFVGATDIKVKQNNYYVNFGYRFTTDGAVKTSHELYMGLGWRNLNYDAIRYNEYVDPITNNTTYNYQKSSEKASFSSPLFIMGYILGFGF